MCPNKCLTSQGQTRCRAITPRSTASYDSCTGGQRRLGPVREGVDVREIVSNDSFADEVLVHTIVTAPQNLVCQTMTSPENVKLRLCVTTRFSQNAVREHERHAQIVDVLQ